MLFRKINQRTKGIKAQRIDTCLESALAQVRTRLEPAKPPPQPSALGPSRPVLDLTTPPQAPRQAQVRPHLCSKKYFASQVLLLHRLK